MQTCIETEGSLKTSLDYVTLEPDTSSTKYCIQSTTASDKHIAILEKFSQTSVYIESIILLTP